MGVFDALIIWEQEILLPHHSQPRTSHPLPTRQTHPCQGTQETGMGGSYTLLHSTKGFTFTNTEEWHSFLYLPWERGDLSVLGLSQDD